MKMKHFFLFVIYLCCFNVLCYETKKDKNLFEKDGDIQLDKEEAAILRSVIPDLKLANLIINTHHLHHEVKTSKRTRIPSEINQRTRIPSEINKLIKNQEKIFRHHHKVKQKHHHPIKHPLGFLKDETISLDFSDDSTRNGFYSKNKLPTSDHHRDFKFHLIDFNKLIERLAKKNKPTSSHRKNRKRKSKLTTTTVKLGSSNLLNGTNRKTTTGKSPKKLIPQSSQFLVLFHKNKDADSVTHGTAGQGVSGSVRRNRIDQQEGSNHINDTIPPLEVNQIHAINNNTGNANRLNQFTKTDANEITNSIKTIGNEIKTINSNIFSVDKPPYVFLHDTKDNKQKQQVDTNLNVTTPLQSNDSAIEIINNQTSDNGILENQVLTRSVTYPSQVISNSSSTGSESEEKLFPLITSPLNQHNVEKNIQSTKVSNVDQFHIKDLIPPQQLDSLSNTNRSQSNESLLNKQNFKDFARHSSMSDSPSNETYKFDQRPNDYGDLSNRSNSFISNAHFAPTNETSSNDLGNNKYYQKDTNATLLPTNCSYFSQLSENDFENNTNDLMLPPSKETSFNQQSRSPFGNLSTPVNFAEKPINSLGNYTIQHNDTLSSPMFLPSNQTFLSEQKPSNFSNYSVTLSSPLNEPYIDQAQPSQQFDRGIAVSNLSDTTERNITANQNVNNETKTFDLNPNSTQFIPIAAIDIWNRTNQGADVSQFIKTKSLDSYITDNHQRRNIIPTAPTNYYRAIIPEEFPSPQYTSLDEDFNYVQIPTVKSQDVLADLLAKESMAETKITDEANSLKTEQTLSRSSTPDLDESSRTPTDANKPKRGYKGLSSDDVGVLRQAIEVGEETLLNYMTKHLPTEEKKENTINLLQASQKKYDVMETNDYKNVNQNEEKENKTTKSLNKVQDVTGAKREPVPGRYVNMTSSDTEGEQGVLDGEQVGYQQQQKSVENQQQALQHDNVPTTQKLVQPLSTATTTTLQQTISNILVSNDQLVFITPIPVVTVEVDKAPEEMHNMQNQTNLYVVANVSTTSQAIPTTMSTKTNALTTTTATLQTTTTTLETTTRTPLATTATPIPSMTTTATPVTIKTTTTDRNWIKPDQSKQATNNITSQGINSRNSTIQNSEQLNNTQSQEAIILSNHNRDVVSTNNRVKNITIEESNEILKNQPNDAILIPGTKRHYHGITTLHKRSKHRLDSRKASVVKTNYPTASVQKNVKNSVPTINVMDEVYPFEEGLIDDQNGKRIRKPMPVTEIKIDQDAKRRDTSNRVVPSHFVDYKYPVDSTYPIETFHHTESLDNQDFNVTNEERVRLKSSSTSTKHHDDESGKSHKITKKHFPTKSRWSKRYKDRTGTKRNLNFTPRRLSHVIEKEVSDAQPKTKIEPTSSQLKRTSSQPTLSTHLTKALNPESQTDDLVPPTLSPSISFVNTDGYGQQQSKKKKILQQQTGQNRQFVQENIMVPIVALPVNTGMNPPTAITMQYQQQQQQPSMENTGLVEASPGIQPESAPQKSVVSVSTMPIMKDTTVAAAEGKEKENNKSEDVETWKNEMSMDDLYWTDSPEEIENACREQKGTNLVVNVMAFGDSLTRGYYNKGQNHHPYTVRLQYLLNKMDNKRCFIVENAGKDGDIAFGEMPKRLELLFKDSKKHYDWVIILGGTNDIYNKLRSARRSSEELTHNIIALHNIAHHHGARTVAITIPEVMCESNDMCEDMKQMRDTINDNLRTYALDHRGTVVLSDMSQLLARSKLKHELRARFFEGGLHFRPRGYETMAKIIFESVKDSID